MHNRLAQLQQRVGLQEFGVREELADVAGAYARHRCLQRLCLARRQLCPIATVRALYRYQAAPPKPHAVVSQPSTEHIPLVHPSLPAILTWL